MRFFLISPLPLFSPSPLSQHRAPPVRLPEDNFGVTPDQELPQDEEEEEEEEDHDAERTGERGEEDAEEGGRGRSMGNGDLAREQRQQQQQQQQLFATAAHPASTPGDAAAAAAAAAALAAPTDRSIYPWGAGDGEEEEDAAVAGAGGRVQGVPSKAEVLALPDGDFLSGCRVMLVGFASDALLPLSLLVRKGCGIR